MMRHKLKKLFFEMNLFKLGSFIWFFIGLLFLYANSRLDWSLWFFVISLVFSLYLYQYHGGLVAKARFSQIFKDFKIDGVIELEEEEGSWKKK